MMTKWLIVPVTAVLWTLAIPSQAFGLSGDGWVSLFNGEDLTGWRGPDNGPWAVIDGTIDCDPARAPDVREHLWTEDAYGDFILYVEWRFTDTPTTERRPLLGADGHPTGEAVEIRNADSGIYLRGQRKSQVNIWNWPAGSGEVWGYRTDGSMPDEVRAAVTPRVRADNEPGEWNTFVITMIGDRLSVVLNGEVVIDHAQLPGVADEGGFGLQYHGGYNADTGEYRDASSLVQFRNIHVKPLD